ncbi:MAG: branched-chain amino acid aminotransferase [Bacillota bacterium]|nr:branched-chain amino acid aminotransferase [Bacillota bacterium]
MLKTQIQQFINEHQNNLQIGKEEIGYLEKHQDTFEENIFYKVLDSKLRFSDAYIERSDKETESLIANESFSFLNQSIDYLKKHKNEFIFLESDWLQLIGVDAISLEADDVFNTYDVMLGLKLQKKYQSLIREFLSNNLHGDHATFDLLFSHEDGLWNLNFALNDVDGFKEDISFNEAYQLIYHLLFQLAEIAE